MNPLSLVVVGVSVLSLMRGAEAEDSGEYSIESKSLEAVLPVYAGSLNEFVTLGTAAYESESAQAALKSWVDSEIKVPIGDGQRHKRPNAWIAIEGGHAVVHARWSLKDLKGQGNGRKEAEGILKPDEFPMLIAIQKRAMAVTKFPKVVAIEVKIMGWFNVVTSPRDVTDGRLALYWSVELQDGRKKAEWKFVVFPAKPGEEALAVGVGGFRALHVHDNNAKDEWSRVIVDDGGSSNSE